MTDELTDVSNHHIEGYTANGHVKIPLISEIVPNLWMGGCRDGVCLPGDFTFVLSLYPWEKYTLGPDTERQEVRLYDSADLPDRDQLDGLADLVNEKHAAGKVLVHCQAGLNRSGMITALALIRSGASPFTAIATLRGKRDESVLCNPTFERYVRAYRRPEQEAA